jgi:hypothetical protein
VNTFTLLTTTYFTTLAALILICAPGLILYDSFEVAQIRSKPLARVTTAFVVGFSVLVTFFFVAGKFGTYVNLILLSFLILSLISIAMMVLNGRLKMLLAEIKLLALASLIGVWQFLPGLKLSNSAGVGMNMVTLNNNDIAFYAGAATEFLESGFQSSAHIASIDLNRDIMTGGYHSPFALISFLASTFQISPWQVTTPAIGIVIGMSFLGLSRLTSSFFQELNTLKSMVIGAAITMSSFMTYIQSNYFFGQIFALVVCALLLSSVIDFTNQKRKLPTQYLEVCFLVVLSIYTYPHFLIAFDLALLLLFAFLFLRNKELTRGNELKKFLGAIGLGLLLSFPNLVNAFKKALLITNVEAGWSLPVLNPLNMTIWPTQFGITTPTHTLIVLWTIALIVILFAIRSDKLKSKDKEAAHIFAVLVPLAVILVIVIRKQGFEEYQSWKLISFAYPLVMAAVLPLLTFRIKFGEKLLWIFLGVTSTTAMTVWGGSPGQLVSKDLLQVSAMQKVKSLESLNISVHPFFETMAAAQVIRGPKIYTNSASYFPVAIDPNACTLVRLSDKTFQYVEALNSTYGLASSSKERCSAKPAGIELDKEIQFNSSLPVPNGTGWGVPEEWGVWTIGEKANLNLQVDLSSKSSLKIYITSNSFLAQKHDTQKVTILVNNSFIGTMRYTLASNLKTRVYEIPNDLLKTLSESISLDFLIDNPVSPASLGVSGDPRELGMGLISIKIG